MNPAHWHLVLNHFPIIGTFIGTLTLLAGLLLKGDAIKKTGLVILLFAAIFAFPVHETGEEAEEIVEEIAGISHELIHEHEEIAEPFNLFAIAIILLGGTSLVMLQRKPALGNKLVIATLLLGIFTSYWAFRVGQSGGKIMHQDIINATSKHDAKEYDDD